jgi:glycerol-3-phosphate responsive antiterminator
MQKLAEALDTLERLVERVENPVEGCAVQIKVSMDLVHVGVYYEQGGEGYVLHNIKKHGVIATKLKDLWKFGWVAEGFYTWN